MTTFALDQIVRQTNEQSRKAVEAMLAGNAAKAFAAFNAGGGRIVEQPGTQTRHAVLARDFATLSARNARTPLCSTRPVRAGRI